MNCLPDGGAYASSTLSAYVPRIFQIESYPGFFDEADMILKKYYKYSARVNLLHSGGICISGITEVSDSYTSTENFIYFNDLNACPIGCISVA